MVNQIIWTKSAQESLLSITEYIENKWGENISINFVKRAFKNY
jgi:plasmid stabilization system protein ParE